jgi:type III restriction enzyme
MKRTFNPIINTPFAEPTQYYRTLPDGSLDYSKVIIGRRPFVPEMPPMPTGVKNQNNFFDLKNLGESFDKNIVNTIRREVADWRNNNYIGITAISKELLYFWFRDSERVNKLFFAQREAIETLIWLNEVASSYNAGTGLLERISSASTIDNRNSELNLPRIALKMATGSGKTVVMALIILYNFLNRVRYHNDVRFSDYFLIVTPGITVKERLSVLFAGPQNKFGVMAKDYYRSFDLVPQKYSDIIDSLNTKIIITNFQSFERRTFRGNKKTPLDGKLGNNKTDSKEDSSLMLRRVLGKFKKGSRLLVINDEAHHCYYPNPHGKIKRRSSEEEENQRASIWYNGLVEVCRNYKVSKVYDLSATPYFLSGSGYPSYTLFPWVVSDFGLVEAMESGLVKIPYLPESDTTHNLDMPVLRDLYRHVKNELPKKGMKKARKDEDFNATKPVIPTILKNAFDQFYSNYEKDYEKYRGLFDNPPVFIVVCNNTRVSSEVFKYLAGYELNKEDGSKIIVNGKFKLFDNFDSQTKTPVTKPPTLLIDSDALENSDQIDASFKEIFSKEIEVYKREYRIIHPERSVENITDSELLREIVNTVGKKGKLGQHIRCVVSVSMLTEGWDANTVTHIMGIRAFGSQLLCEQVAGRALRRVNYDAFDKQGKYTPEYAQIIGVPFSFFRKGASVTPVQPKNVTSIHSLPERRAKFEINFPNVIGYRLETDETIIKADFSKVESYELDGTKYPASTVMKNAFSPHEEKLSLDQIKNKRRQELVFAITRMLIALKFSDENRNPKFHLFNSLKAIVTLWLNDKVKLLGDAFENMLFYESESKVCEHIMRGIHAAVDSKEKIVPVFNFYNKFGSTNFVFGRTSRNVFPTKKSHVNYVVADTDSWEQIAAKTLDEMPEVKSYVKNAFLGFKIPYVHPEKDNPNYEPDFIALCKTKKGKMINLIIEITGMNKDKIEKKWYTENRWIPAVNNVKDIYGYNEWAFIEIAGDVRDIKNDLRNFINDLN